MRFGLEDGSEDTLEEVGQSFAVTRERLLSFTTEARSHRKKNFIGHGLTRINTDFLWARLRPADERKADSFSRQGR